MTYVVSFSLSLVIASSCSAFSAVAGVVAVQDPSDIPCIGSLSGWLRSSVLVFPFFGVDEESCGFFYVWLRLVLFYRTVRRWLGQNYSALIMERGLPCASKNRATLFMHLAGISVRSSLAASISPHGIAVWHSITASEGP